MVGRSEYDGYNAQNHVYLPPNWKDRLPTNITELKKRLLQELWDAEQNDKAACQKSFEKRNELFMRLNECYRRLRQWVADKPVGTQGAHPINERTRCFTQRFLTRLAVF